MLSAQYIIYRIPLVRPRSDCQVVHVSPSILPSHVELGYLRIVRLASELDYRAGPAECVAWHPPSAGYVSHASTTGTSHDSWTARYEGWKDSQPVMESFGSERAPLADGWGR
jgi:hypothetical protein